MAGNLAVGCVEIGDPADDGALHIRRLEPKPLLEVNLGPRFA
jgi:hypothetical protein